MNKKSPLASKTLWFNALGMLAMLFGDGGMLGHVLAPDEVALGMGVGNMVLRFLTDKSILN